MQLLQTPDGRPLDDAAAKLYHAVGTLARLNFILVGVLLVAGNSMCSASMFGLAIPFYQAGAIQALLAGDQALGGALVGPAGFEPAT